MSKKRLAFVSIVFSIPILLYISLFIYIEICKWVIDMFDDYEEFLLDKILKFHNWLDKLNFK